MPLTFRLAKDYPVDLYYLMDLSQSMADDKKKVADLGINLGKILSDWIVISSSNSISPGLYFFNNAHHSYILYLFNYVWCV